MAIDNKYRNLVVLRSVYGKVGIKYFIQPSRDPKTGRYPDCVKYVDSKGDLILTDAEKNSGNVWIGENQTFEVVDGTTFDMDNPWDRAKWEAIQHCPIIAPYRKAKDKNGVYLIDGDTKMKGDYKSVAKAKYGVAELYVERPGEETQIKVTKKKLQHKAITYIVEDPKGAAGRALIAKLMGKSMRNAPDADVEDYLISVAEKNPERIIDLYTGEDTGLRLLFVEAREKSIIITKNKLYVYGEGTVLGATDDAVIAWMRDPKNVHILELIRRDTNPELYEKKEYNYAAKLQDEQPITYSSNSGELNKVEVDDTPKGVVITGELPPKSSAGKLKK